MPRPLRFPVPDLAASTLEIYAGEDWAEVPDCEDLAAACAAYLAGGPYLTSTTPRVVVVDLDDAAQVERVARGLVDLANTEDEVAEGRHADPDPDVRRSARHACRGLSTLATRIRLAAP